MGIDNLKHDNKRKVIISVLKILLLIAIVAGIPLYIYFFQYALKHVQRKTFGEGAMTNHCYHLPFF